MTLWLQTAILELLSNEEKWSEKEYKIVGQQEIEYWSCQITYLVNVSNQSEPTDLAIAPSLRCRSPQSCQRLESRVVACKVKVKSDSKR